MAEPDGSDPMDYRLTPLYWKCPTCGDMHSDLSAFADNEVPRCGEDHSDYAQDRGSALEPVYLDSPEGRAEHPRLHEEVFRRWRTDL